MNIEIVIASISLLGIVLSALMGSYGYLYKAKAEQKRNSRRVLYVLLEIRLSILKSLIKPETAKDKYLEYLISRIKSLGADVNSADMPENFTIAIEEHIGNVIQASMKDIESELKNEYEEALSAMAPENPVLAYSLRSKEAIEQVLGHTESYLDTTRKNLSDLDAEAWVLKALNKILDETKQQVEVDIIQMLNEDVKKLATVCGATERKAVKKIIEKQSSIHNFLNFDDLDRFFDKYIKNITEAANKQAGDKL